jgi:hypothetical protein
VTLTHIAINRQGRLTALVAEGDARQRSLASALRVCALQKFFSQPSIATARSDGQPSRTSLSGGRGAVAHGDHILGESLLVQPLP